MKIESLFDLKSKETANASLAKLLAGRQPYQLPGDPSTHTYLLPVSGGADSTALAILMHYLFPQINFLMCFTDTMAEDPEIYIVLDKLETYLGKPITRVLPEMGLFELIEVYGGFLPSSQSRYCTRELKLESFKKWMKTLDGVPKVMTVGIRADETTRLAFTIDDVQTEMPYVDMGLMREDVFAILSHTIGIPRFYRRRTRSGCSTCFFQRRSELVGLLQEQPIEFTKGIQTEKLSEGDKQRHPEAPPLWRDSGIAANWLSLPSPQDGDSITGKKSKLKTMDIFGMRGIFVGAEFFMDGMFFNDEFIWHQRVVSYSPTLAGIRRQLDDRYRHLLGTGEVYEMSPEQVRAQARFAIYYVELPDSVFDPDGPTGDGYTWQKDTSYQQLRHIVQWVTRALQAEQLRQQAQKKASLLSVQYEWIESATNALTKIQNAVGNVVTSQWYQPTEKEPEMSAEEEVKTVPCPMCSI